MSAAPILTDLHQILHHARSRALAAAVLYGPAAPHGHQRTGVVAAELADGSVRAVVGPIRGLTGLISEPAIARAVLGPAGAVALARRGRTEPAWSDAVCEVVAALEERGKVLA